MCVASDPISLYIKFYVQQLTCSKWAYGCTVHKDLQRIDMYVSTVYILTQVGILGGYPKILSIKI